MSLYKQLVVCAILLVALASHVEAEQNKALPVANGKISSKHINAVGAVFTIENATASIGTGTYIGEKRILTAGHLFKSLLPKSVPQKTGPVRIDISHKRVFWSNETILDLSIPPDVLYRAKYLTVDASFINAFNANLVDPDKDDVKADIAILTLEAPVKNLTGVSVPEIRSELPKEGLLVGYGKRSKPNHEKQTMVQTLHGLMDMGDWGIMMSNLVADIQASVNGNSPAPKKEFELLLGKENLDHKDMQIIRAAQGDSGGPLLAMTKDNKIHIIGIMSANSKAFNAFASLVVKTPSGYFRNPNLDALLRASR